ncbi:tetratricopeptide repeat protein [Candidatus Peregrinibacteria bacterium]|nr:tetratricopeptide repeat protein [Candidatus Peregrinibacteria bacterium]
MKLQVRIIAPVVLAIICAGTLATFLWWQLSQSTLLLQRSASEQEVTIDTNSDVISTTVLTDPRDQALFHLRQGDMLAVRNEWAGAAAQYEQAVEAGGGLPALRKMAQAQLQRRDMKGVQETIKKMKKEGARAEDLLLLESIVALRKGELVQTKSLLENADDSPQKEYGLSLLSIIEGNHTAAREHLDNVINGWEPVLRTYARTLVAAYQEFELFSESQNIHLVTLLSRALAQVQECELALPLLIQVTQTKGDYRDAWIVQGYCELSTERPEQALASLEQAYNIDPQKPEVQYFLGRAYEETGDLANANTFFRYALANGFRPESEIRRSIAKIEYSIGNVSEALQQYEVLTSLPDASLESFHGYITTSVEAGKTEEAFYMAQKAVEKYPDDPSAYELLGWAAMEADKIEESREALETALEMSPFLEGAKDKLKQLDD